jgi:hypothetical protein
MNVHNFCFESYGVPVAIEASSKELIELAEKTARYALLGNLTEIKRDSAEQVFQLELLSNGECRIIQNGEEMATGELGPKIWKFFDSLVRILIAEHCNSLVFVHAGVVGWRGKTLVFPGDSFAGKTTLVAELVRNGAEYYSDEYALFDQCGLVHPFARPLSLRSSGKSITETDIAVEDLGGHSAQVPKPVGCVLFSKYDPASEWNPQILSVGKGMMEILPQTIAIRRNTEFAINILKNAITSAIIVKSARFDATRFVRQFLEFVDNTAF